MFENLNIYITGTRFTGNNTVSIDFRGNNAPRNININGYIPDIAMQDYFDNVRSIEDMESFVRQELDKALNGTEGTENATATASGSGEIRTMSIQQQEPDATGEPHTTAEQTTAGRGNKGKGNARR